MRPTVTQQAEPSFLEPVEAEAPGAAVTRRPADPDATFLRRWYSEEPKSPKRDWVLSLMAFGVITFIFCAGSILLWLGGGALSDALAQRGAVLCGVSLCSMLAAFVVGGGFDPTVAGGNSR